MANVKISDLVSTNPFATIDGTEQFEGVQSSDSAGATFEQFRKALFPTGSMQWGYNETAPYYGLAVDYDNDVSQTTYADLFALVGHNFNASHVAAGDTDLSASGTLFYPTPIPGAYARAANRPDAFTDAEISTSGDAIQGLVSAAWRGNVRVGSPFAFEVVSGTVPTGLVDGTIYYVVPTTTGYGLFPTETDAIAGTSEVSPSTTGSGSFRLVQAGIRLDDAFQGFDRYSGYGRDTAAAGGVYGTVAPGDTPGVATFVATLTSGTPNRQIINSDPKDDSVNGVPRVTNETRPDTDYMYGYIAT